MLIPVLLTLQTAKVKSHFVMNQIVLFGEQSVFICSLHIGQLPYLFYETESYHIQQHFGIPHRSHRHTTDIHSGR